MKLEDLKFKVEYNFASDAVFFIGSISNFKEEGSFNCAAPRQQFLQSPCKVIQESINSIINSLKEVYIKNPDPHCDNEANAVECNPEELSQVS